MVTRRRIISVSRDTLQKQENPDYSKGYNSYLANDVVPENQLVYATDTRISTLGRQKTRQGCDFYSVPAGETVDQQQTSATGAADKSISLTTWLAAKFTAGATGRLTKVELELKNAASATGPIIVEIRADNAGSPSSTVTAQSSVPASTPTSSYAYCVARFIEAPQVANGTAYWIVAYIQDDGSNTYAWNSTTSATTSKTSSDSGSTWSSTSYALHIKTYVSTDSPVLGQYRAYKSDGTKKTLMAHGTDLYTVNDGTGAITSIKSSLSGSATLYQFETANDVVYYVNGFDAPRKWDFTTESAMGGSPPGNGKFIALHKNRLFFIDATDPTKLFFTNAGAFETFTSTDFLYVPSPKSPDPVTGMAVLNDNLYIFTRLTKWVLFGSDISNMILRKAPGTKGTTATRSIQVTRNHIYFTSDDGFYRFNGSTDELLSRDITADYAAATNRDNWGSALFNNRYYVFYTPSGEAKNSRCWVYNINYGSLESNDTSTYIASTKVWNGAADSGQFLQASNLVGALYYGEQSSNLYNNLGKMLTWEIRTKYEHFGNPSAQKQIKRWYPRFAAAGGPYSVSAQYDKDFRGSPTTIPIALQGTGTTWGSGALWGAFTWGTTSLVDTRETIPGPADYIQLRYKRLGVNTPVEFLGHTLYYFTRRAR